MSWDERAECLVEELERTRAREELTAEEMWWTPSSAHTLVDTNEPRAGQDLRAEANERKRKGSSLHHRLVSLASSHANHQSVLLLLGPGPQPGSLSLLLDEHELNVLLLEVQARGGEDDE